jgi:cytochrome b6-f complex iron-sulfur subunit
MEQPRSRRDVVKLLAAAWALLAAVPVLRALFEYLAPRAETVARGATIPAPGAMELTAGTARIIRFQREPVILVRTTAGQFKAFSARCTHLGCVVEYVSDPPHFACHCHGSIFDADGVNRAGPASRPLPPFKVSVSDDQVFLTRV